MQTCTFFASYIPYFTRELEKNDPDLNGTDRPVTMSKQQWHRFQTERASKHSSSTSSSTGSSSTDIAKMSDLLDKYEFNFSRNLQILLDNLNHYAATETVVLLGLCARLSTANQG